MRKENKRAQRSQPQGGGESYRKTCDAVDLIHPQVHRDWDFFRSEANTRGIHDNDTIHEQDPRGINLTEGFRRGQFPV